MVSRSRAFNLVVVFSLLVSLVAVGVAVQPRRALAETRTFAQSTPISIPTSSSVSRADPYPLSITVPNNPDGFVVGVSVTLNGLSHSAPFDLDILLVGPTGRSVLLMSDAGSTTDLNNATLTFNSSAVASLPSSGAIPNGTYRPTNYGSGDTFPTPAPSAPKGGYGTNLATFNNVNRVGVWKLYIVDDLATAFTGELARGWTLSLQVSYIEATFTEMFSTTGNALIQNIAVANPYPSRITVSGMTGSIVSVRASLSLTHTSPDDLDILLVGPAGGSGVVLMSDVGGAVDVTDVVLTFDDAAPGVIPDSGPLSGGRVRPTDIDTGADDAIVHPAPTRPHAGALSAFDSTSPNGTWSLYVLDDRPSQDAGTINSWMLEISTNRPPSPVPAPNVIADAGTEREIILHATDPDGDHLTWAGIDFPPYITVDRVSSDGSIAVLLVSPAASDIGDDIQVRVAVSDPFSTVNLQFRLQVIEDSTAPIVEYHPNPVPNVNGWVNEPIFIEILGVDEPGGSGIARMIVYLDDGTTQQSVGPRRTFASNVNGEKIINYQTIDNGGNASPITPFTVRIDESAPVIGAVSMRLPASGQLPRLMSGETLVPVQARWSGTDSVSGIAQYGLHLETDAVDGLTIPLNNPLAKQQNVPLRPNSTYRFIVNATDLADNISEQRFSPFRDVLLRADTNGSTTYSSGWNIGNNTNFTDGRAHTSNVTGASATFTFTGRSIAWVTSKGPNRGIAEISIDGGTPVQVDTFSSTAKVRQLAFAANNLTNGTHTITIRVTGQRKAAATGATIFIDGFAILR